LSLWPAAISPVIICFLKYSVAMFVTVLISIVYKFRLQYTVFSSLNVNVCQEKLCMILLFLTRASSEPRSSGPSVNKQPAVYILASKQNGTSIGSYFRSYLRSHQEDMGTQNNMAESFTKCCVIYQPVWYEAHENMGFSIFLIRHSGESRNPERYILFCPSIFLRVQ
jgi:hypothetical protein